MEFFRDPEVDWGTRHATTQRAKILSLLLRATVIRCQSKAANRSLVEEFHRALHQACGLPALRPSMGDERAWWDFLQEMAPLSEDESGPFTVADIEGAVREMRREKQDGKAGWALRPSTILRNPEGFRDMVLLFRTNRRARRLKERKPTHLPAPVAPSEPSISEEEFDRSIAELRKNLRGGTL